jgi:hypothetical protein
MKVLVGLDSSDHALVALEYVACLALTQDDEVILVGSRRRLHARSSSSLPSSDPVAGVADGTDRGTGRVGVFGRPRRPAARERRP